ncbi:hypothetical protein [Robiginitalea sp.]|uniref:hypothetical protein n=1 Tax=Robiginitalea sp. TaxID=1902411 RepID=UPI003C738531
MNTRKIFFAILTIGILSGAACTTDNDEAYEVSSIDRDKVVTGPKKQAIDRDKIVTGPKKQAIDRDKIVTGPKKKSE